MSNITNTSDTSVVVGHTAMVLGATATERKLSILNIACTATTMALASAGGAVGKTAVRRIAKGGLDTIAFDASHANYRPVAEYFAAQLGETFVVRRRADFESLPSQMEARVYKAKLAKNGGMRLCKKTGEMVNGATLARLISLHTDAVNLVAEANRLFAERLEAKREAVAAE